MNLTNSTIRQKQRYKNSSNDKMIITALSKIADCLVPKASILSEIIDSDSLRYYEL